MLRGSSCSPWIAVGLLSLTLGSPLSRAEDEAPRASERRDQRLAEKLAENVDVYENGVPLRTFVTDLAMRQGVEVRFDEREIAAQSIPLDRPVSVNRKGATLESVFARVLRKYGLEARRDGGVIVIGCMRRQPAAAQVVRQIPRDQFIRDFEDRPRIRIYVVQDELAFDLDAGYITVDPRLTAEELKQPRTIQRLLFSWLIEGGSPERLTEQLQTHLSHQLEADHVICGLTEIQREKLRLAGQREIQHHVMQASQLCEKCAEGYDPDDASIGVPRAHFEEVRRLAISRQLGLFGADSLFEKMRNRTLTSSQRRRLEAVASLQDAGAAVNARPRQVGIREIHLSTRPVTDAILPNLAELPELESLSLDSTQITEDGLKHIESLQNLTWLDLNRTKVGNDGLKHVARLPRLERLELSGTLVTDSGIELLTSLKNLKSIDLSDTAVTKTGIAKLRSTFPEITIVH